MNETNITILAIESSCDDTSAAIIHNGEVRSNMVAGQKIHEQYGGVVPELASRAHQQHIVPVVDAAFKQAGLTPNDLSAVAFTAGPGLIGSLMVGSSFAKAMALARGIPLITVNHMQAHILAHFIDDPKPGFPFLCLTVSGGHTQIVKVTDYFQHEVIGQTIDDAAGEAFDKAAKILGLPYPGGPLIDKHAASGDPAAYTFPVSQMPGFDFSFSGIKTSILYFIRKEVEKDQDFVSKNLNNICASIQHAIIKQLMKKLVGAARETGIKNIALAGGVSANSGLRAALEKEGRNRGWKTFIPAFEYCTDNAGMIAIAAHYKFMAGDFATQEAAPYAR